jgi:hypothetical protein
MEVRVGRPRSRYLIVNADDLGLSKGLKNILARLPAGFTELVCHPGYADGLGTMYRIERAIEMRVLCLPEIRETLSRLQIELSSFHDLGRLRFVNRPQACTIRNLRAPMENSNVEDDQKSTNPRCLPDDKAVPPEHDEELEPACALR